MNRHELAERLTAELFDPNTFSLHGTFPSYEGIVLRYEEPKWKIIYSELGAERLLNEADSEARACELVYEMLKKYFPPRQVK